MRHGRRLWVLGLVGLLACGWCLNVVAQGRTSANDERLERALKRFPEADANKDGILTPQEAQAFRREMVSKREGRKAGQALPTPTHANLAYGPHERNVLDLWLPEKGKKPFPLVIFIHGGGFVGGSKEKLSLLMLDKCRKEGIAVASINYRFLGHAALPGPLQDGTRAVQFLRHKAKEYGLDAKHFAAYGGSAGAGISLWLAFHDDLKNPESEDPVAKESSRVCCVGNMSGQPSYEPKVLRDWVGDEVLKHPCVLMLYRVTSLDDVLEPTDELAARMAESSPIHHLTKDDPPVISLYREGRGVADPGAAVHSVILGEKLKEAMDALEIESELHTQGPNEGNARWDTMFAFFKRHFGIAEAPKASAN